MWNRLIDYLFSEPRRFGWLGQACVSTGLFILVAGCAGWAVRSMLEVAQRHAPLTLPRTLAELYPMLWTWWVPESIVGTLPSLLLVGFGLWLSTVGRRVVRIYGC